jgi:cellulose synthase/poly-beta-1,6-N-acetylglucosamine synthase-like glycosyltransferase
MDMRRDGDGTGSAPIRCSVGVMAHNEERNVGALIEALVTQQGTRAVVTEIIVVASGCTDGTKKIVRRWAERDDRIQLIVQARREGKASAVNLFLARAREDVLVLCSADLVPARDTLDQLVAPFADPAIGLTTCRPVPVNDPGTFLGFAAHLQWELHHQMNLVAFKAGELIAFRKVFQRIPYTTSVDEACIEPVVRGQGYGVRYVGSAVVHNKGPETLDDFLSQRRRIYAGHHALAHEVGYRVSTMSAWNVLRLLVKGMDWRPRPFVWTCAVAGLEAVGRLLGTRDYQEKRDHTVWRIATTTKRLGPVLRPSSAAGTP